MSLRMIATMATLMGFQLHGVVTLGILLNTIFVWALMGRGIRVQFSVFFFQYYGPRFRFLASSSGRFDRVVSDHAEICPPISSDTTAPSGMMPEVAGS
jgi:hypothetical protein